MCSYVTMQLGTPRASSVSGFIVHLNFIKENYHKLQQVSRDLLTALEAFSLSPSLKTQGRKEVVNNRPQHWHLKVPEIHVKYSVPTTLHNWTYFSSSLD